MLASALRTRLVPVALRHAPAAGPSARVACGQLFLARHKSKKTKGVEVDDTPPPPPAGKRDHSTANLVPGSQLKVGTEEGEAAFAETEDKMKAALEHLRKEFATMELQGSGRVTPAVLDPVRVELPDVPGSGPRLNEIATIGVREGTTLLISVYDESTTKHVEKAIYAAKIPHVVPQRVDNATIKVVMPKPTVEARKTIFAQASKMTEDLRVQLRRTREAGEKKAKVTKHSKGIDEFQKLNTKYSAELDKLLEKTKKNMQ